MNKKISFSLVCITLFILCLIPILHGKTSRHTDAPLSRAEADEITGTRQEKKDLVKNVIIGDQELIYDSASNEYFYSMREGAEDDFCPDIRVTSDHSRVLVRMVDGSVTKDAIRNNESITLLFYSRDYYFYSALKCTTLPVMSIECDSKINEEYTQMSFYLYDNRKDSDKRITMSDGKIRKRGGYTAQYPKFPLRFKLQTHSPGQNARSFSTSLLGMRENSSWILYPAYNDNDKVRNVFSQNLWFDTVGDNNQFHLATGPEYRYLEVFVNGRYNGLYALGYTIDEKSMDIDPTDDGQGLFKKVLDTRYDLLEMRNRNEDAVRGYRLITDEVSAPDTISGKWRALVDYFLFLNKYKYKSDELLDEIDLDNAIDFALFTDLVQGDDSIYKNFYLAIKRDDAGKKKTLYCTWDLDSTWGNEVRKSALNSYAQYSHTPDYNFFMEDTYLEQILVNGDTDTIDTYIERYRNLRKDKWSDENIKSVLDGYEEDIFFSGAYLREMERWPDANYMDGPDYDLSKFRKYVLERFAEFDAYFDRLEEVKYDSLFFRRKAALKHFDESDIVIEIKDRELLEDEDYIDFLESIAPINIANLTDDIRYVIYLREKNLVQYIPDIGDVGNAYVSEELSLVKDTYPDADYFEFYDDGVYTIFLNGVPCYDSSSYINEGLVISIVHDGIGEKMNTAIDYHLTIDDSVYEFYDS